MLKAVVFDLDGTLLDTIPDIAAALNHSLAANGLPTHPAKAVEGFVGGGIRSAVVKAAPAGSSEAVIEQVLAGVPRRVRGPLHGQDHTRSRVGWRTCSPPSPPGASSWGC